MNQTNALNEIPFMTSIKLHVSALGCHPQGSKKNIDKGIQIQHDTLGFLEDGTPLLNM
jgi:hypothetical protein